MHASFRSSSAVFARMLAVLLLAGCSDDPARPIDDTPPSLTAVEAIDGWHIRVSFDESLDRASAEDESNYTIANTALNSAGATSSSAPSVTYAALLSDQRTVMLSCNFLGTSSYGITISGVRDAHGNRGKEPLGQYFTGSGSRDNTPPEVTLSTPGPSAKGVTLLSDVTVEFSESIRPPNQVPSPFRWETNGEPVAFWASTSWGTTLALSPGETLKPGTVYTITLVDIRDDFGNTIAPVSWSFQTVAQYDHSATRIVSTSPAHLATNVPLQTTLTFRFNKPVYRNGIGLRIFPEPYAYDLASSSDYLTLSIRAELQPQTQYAVVVLPGALKDYNGVRSTELMDIRFTTGPAIATGAISGSISPDPGSDYTDHLERAVVGAVRHPVYGWYLDNLAGAAAVTESGSYTVPNLPDGMYEPIVLTDSNGDGFMRPETGDAFVYFGTDYANLDFDPDSLSVTGGGEVSNINMTLFDASALTGTILYAGTSNTRSASVGFYRVDGFDPDQQPDFMDSIYWFGDGMWLQVYTFLAGVPDGTYYVRVVLDANGDDVFDPATEPSGFYGGNTPIPVTFNRGSDVNGIEIVLEDPSPAARTSSSAWRCTRQSWRDCTPGITERHPE